MKKTFLGLFLAMMAMVVMTSCGGEGASSPEDAVDGVMSGIINKDPEAIVKYLCGKDGDKLIESEKKEAIENLREGFQRERKLPVSYEIVNVKEDKDDGYVNVKVKATMADGDIDSRRFQCYRNGDRWYVKY